MSRTRRKTPHNIYKKEGTRERRRFNRRIRARLRHALRNGRWDSGGKYYKTGGWLTW